MLQRDKSWKPKYAKYAKGMRDNHYKIANHRKELHIPKPLGIYITLGNSKNGQALYDLRYLGRSVGNIIAENDELFFSAKGDIKAQNGKKLFVPKKGGEKESWKASLKAKEFRKFFKTAVQPQYFPYQQEHMVEARLFDEFSKRTSKGKALLNIQPIKFAGCLTHMKTAVLASKSKNGKVSVSTLGGEIDMFCRRKIGNQSRLAVIELKDKVEFDEDFEDAIYQAISYAVFIRELIHTRSGKDWLKIWGMGEYHIKKGITIEAVVAIPDDIIKTPKFGGQIIKLDKDTLELHYIALSKNILDPTNTAPIKVIGTSLE